MRDREDSRQYVMEFDTLNIYRLPFYFQPLLQLAKRGVAQGMVQVLPARQTSEPVVFHVVPHSEFSVAEQVVSNFIF